MSGSLTSRPSHVLSCLETSDFTSLVFDSVGSAIRNFLRFGVLYAGTNLKAKVDSDLRAASEVMMSTLGLLP